MAESKRPVDNEKGLIGDVPSHDAAPVKGSDHAMLEAMIYDDKFERTQRGLKSRHTQMIALGGTIGTGLFVGSGQTLARGGPAFILGCYVLVSFMVFAIVTAIVEVAAYLPTPGSSMTLFGHRYVGKTVGFSLGWLYFYSLGLLIPYEITAAGLVIEYWNPPVNISVWITIMLLIIVALNFCPVGVYGETEFWFAGTKVIMMIGLLFLSVILFFGGGPSHDRLGFRYWKNPGAANTYIYEGGVGRFCALLSTLVLSIISFTFAPELLITTAGEMKAPRRNLPIATKRYIYRLVIFYIGSILAISVICPSNAPEISSGGKGAGASPFVAAIKRAGIPILNHIVNAVILISAWSSGNSYMYLSSRSLYALALSGNAPRFFKACTKQGVPYLCVLASSLFAFLAYLNAGTSSAVVFNWFVNLTNTSTFISWMFCCFTYLRFRKAVEVQGIPVESLPYRNNWMQPWSSYLAIGFFAFMLLINGFDTFLYKGQGVPFSVSKFFTAYVGIPLFLAIFLGHRLYARHDPLVRRPEDVDMHTGMEDVLRAEQNDPPRARRPWYFEYPSRLWE